MTLDRAEIPERIAYARTRRKLPTILSADEVVRLLAVPSLKARVALTTADAAGLRVLEAVSLKLADLDSDRMLIQVCYGKGAKHRMVMLSPQLLGILAHLLAIGAPGAVAVSRTGRQADRRPGSSRGLPFCGQGGGTGQAGERAHAAA